MMKAAKHLKSQGAIKWFEFVIINSQLVLKTCGRRRRHFKYYSLEEATRLAGEIDGQHGERDGAGVGGGAGEVRDPYGAEE